QLLQALQKCPQACLRRRIVGSKAIEHADAPNALALLRVRSERPRRRRAAEERDELAPFHCPIPPVLPNERNSTPRAAALRDFRPLYDRYGSFASFPPSRHVRFAPRADILSKAAL